MEQIHTWYSVTLGDGMWAPTLTAQIEETFLPLFSEAGKPVNMAVFTRSESEGRLHGEVIAYFSPAVGEVAKAFDVEPCEKPSRNGLGLLAGDRVVGCSFSPKPNEIRYIHLFLNILELNNVIFI